MPDIRSLTTDTASLVDVSIEQGQSAVNMVVSAAAKDGQLGNSRLAFPILAAIEDEARNLITAMQVPFRGVVSKRKTDFAQARATLDQALDRYLDASKSWGRDSPAFPQGRNGLLDRDHPRICTKARSRLDLIARDTADQVKPGPLWEDKWVPLAISFGSFLISLISLAYSVFGTRTR